MAGLLRFCIKHALWSVFEMADMCIEIQTTRGISAQIIRHRSFHFQEFSLRYSVATQIERVRPRRQDLKNRQSSHDDLPSDTLEWFERAQDEHFGEARKLYDAALEKGIAKESARFLLPLATGTTIYMKGSVRDWIHYINLRTDPGTQSEHRDVALACKEIFVEQLPVVADALGWTQTAISSNGNP
ncbi:MAG: FAD-dependent thymidylate synthase [Candidatus Eremiobacteraeota bacterium]|nr:FAD-dependent thymidylate synthase [Candidatus Eremiobacteraeota bacterium]